MLKTMSRPSFFAQARMFSQSSMFLLKIVAETPKLNGTRFCSSRIASMVSFALSKPFFTWRTSLCISPTPSIETRVLKMTPFSWQASATLVIIGMARCGVRPVVLMPYFRSFGSRSRKTCETSTMSFLVVGSPPESMHISTFFQSGFWKTRSICSSVMSLLRSPRCQLLHISQRASQTNVQWKIRTVG